MMPTPCRPPSIRAPRTYAGVWPVSPDRDRGSRAGCLPMRPTTQAATSGRVAVHGCQPVMSEGEDGRHVHSSTDNLDIGAGFAFTGGFHRRVEFAERCDPRGEPIGASERARQFRISPVREVVVGPVGIFLERPLDQISVVVENK